MNIVTKLINPEQVEKILGIEEGHFIDLKAKDISPNKLTKTISAFANSSGGEIYVGLDQVIGINGYERRWRGFANIEEANAHIQTIESLSPLGNHYSITFLESEKYTGLVAQITILKTKEVLHASDSNTYIRRGAQSLPVVGDEALQRLRFEKGIISFEDELLRQMKIDEIANSKTIIEFILDAIPSTEPEPWLEKQKIIVDSTPTVAAALLFSDEPQINLPKRSAIKIYQYKTTGDSERDTLAFTPITIEGAIYDLIFNAVEQCRQIIESIEKLTETGLEKISYPHEALHELITNAVLHRDYSIAADVQIRIFDNRIEIESPGRFPGHITPNNVLKEQFARNPKIVRLINKFPDPPNKDVGEGLNTAFEAMQKLRLKPPIISEQENSVLVTLRHESLGSPEQLVMKYMETHEIITNSIAREITGIKSENTMKRVFYGLRDSNLLEQTPESRQKWRKKEK